MATHTKKHVKNNTKREFVTALEGTTYARVKDSKGDLRFGIEIIKTGEITVAKARGSLKGTSNRIKPNDTVLIQEGKPIYILIKYTDEEVNKLLKMGELVSFKPTLENQSGVDFEDDESNKEIENLEIDEKFISEI